MEAPGGIIVNGLETRTMNLVTERKFSDFELHLEFMLAKRSNSGVYHHGLYEVQVFDSYGSTRPLSYNDGGGIYQRWDKGKGFRRIRAAQQRLAASRPVAVLSHLVSRAPLRRRAGAKTENARFERIVYNGVTIHENVVCDGPTRSAMKIPEAAANPLMLQGDHGPVAFRNIYFRPLPRN